MIAEKVKGLIGYKRITVTCEKCKSRIIYESDYLTEVQAKAQHKCSPVKKIKQEEK